MVFAGYNQNAYDVIEGALFFETGVSNRVDTTKGGGGGLVVVRNIALFSHCESCLLPFKVNCHVGYVPSGQHVVGLSKMARVANVFAKRLQEPQRLADEISTALQTTIKPLGVAVALQCWHIHLPELGKKNPNMQNSRELDIISCSGVFNDEASSPWVEFQALLKFGGIDVVKREKSCFSSLNNWCPLLKSPSKLEKALPDAMVTAATRIITILGEDPLRKELLCTPHRFVRWMLTFKRASFDLKLTNGNVTREKIETFCSELSLPFCSQCEHHLLPFYGVVHIGFFIPQESMPIDRSLLHSIVLFYGCQLQVQERLTRQIAETVFSIYGGGVIVVVEADHICMASRGIEKMGSSTATTAAVGHFSTNPEAKSRFIQSIIDSR